VFDLDGECKFIKTKHYSDYRNMFFLAVTLNTRRFCLQKGGSHLMAKMELLLPISLSSERNNFPPECFFYASHQLPILKTVYITKWCRAYREVHGRRVSVHAELGVESLEVLLVQLQHILNVQYLQTRSTTQCHGFCTAVLKKWLNEFPLFKTKRIKGYGYASVILENIKKKIFVHCQTEKLPFNPVFKVRLHFAAGSTTGCTF